MGLVLLFMAAGAAILAAQMVALVLFRETAVATQIVLPVVMTLIALVAGMVLGDRKGGQMDLAANAQFLQAVAALVGTSLLTGFGLFFLKPARSRVTFMRSLTIALASMAAMLGAVRLWASMLV
ncbi:MAG: hypothetical protein IT548_04250 [Alphaproteobacteria bacterium]|nr:hypothetical protein [Alphaproteobacteria bacterium]